MAGRRKELSERGKKEGRTDSNTDRRMAESKEGSKEEWKEGWNRIEEGNKERREEGRKINPDRLQNPLGLEWVKTEGVQRQHQAASCHAGVKYEPGKWVVCLWRSGWPEGRRGEIRGACLQVRVVRTLKSVGESLIGELTLICGSKSLTRGVAVKKESANPPHPPTGSGFPPEQGVRNENNGRWRKGRVSGGPNTPHPVSRDNRAQRSRGVAGITGQGLSSPV